MNDVQTDVGDSPASPAEHPGPSRAAAMLAAAMPLVASLTAAVTLVVAHGPRGMLALAEDAGWAFYGAGLVTAAAAVVMGALLWRVGRDPTVPTLLSLGVAGLPWCVGQLGAMQRVEGALPVFAQLPMTRHDRVVAAVFTEISGAALVGAWGTSALAGGLALGLAIAALGQRATEKPRFGAAVGALGALPLVALAAYAVVSGALGAQASLYVVATVRAGFALVLAAAAVGVSSRGRAGALAAAVGPVSVVALMTAGQAAVHGAVRGALRGAVVSAPEVALQGAAAAVRASSMGAAIFMSAVGLLLVVSLLLARWAYARGGPSQEPMLGAVALTALSVGFSVASGLGDAKRAEGLAQTAAPPWAAQSDFRPTYVPARDDTALMTAAATITEEGVRIFGSGAVIPVAVATTPGGRRALAAGFRAARAQLELGAGRSDRDAPPPGRSRAGLIEPALTLAFDARVGAPLLRAVLEAAAETGARSVDLVGLRASPLAIAFAVPDAARRADVRPFRPIVEACGSVRVLLAHDVDPRVVEGDTTLWHATVGAAVEGFAKLEPREGSRSEPIAFELAWEGPPLAPREFDAAEPRPLAWLQLGDDVTAQSLVGFARGAAAEGLDPIVVTTPTLPGDTEASP
jgi:hypothetical protein